MADNSDENFDKTSVVPSDTFKLKMQEAKTNPPTLVLLMGPLGQIGKQWKLATSPMLIGRLPDLEISVDDRSISRKHAQIKVLNGKVFIEDLGSSNGTEVNSDKLQAGITRELLDNEQIKMGNVIFKYLAEGNIEATTNQEQMSRAITDPLTKAYNKLAFLERVEEVFKKAKLTQVTLSLIVFDLDKFKTLNDTYGHQAGDFVLFELAKVIKQKLRPSDFFSRYGGEEFTILVTGGNLKVSVELAERMRKAIETHEFMYNGIKLPVTISAGVASLLPNMEKWEELFEQADKAAYKSKHEGRNRVSTIQDL
jgi:two-component system cell cycle response regulator